MPSSTSTSPDRGSPSSFRKQQQLPHSEGNSAFMTPHKIRSNLTSDQNLSRHHSASRKQQQQQQQHQGFDDDNDNNSPDHHLQDETETSFFNDGSASVPATNETTSHHDDDSKITSSATSSVAHHHRKGSLLKNGGATSTVSTATSSSINGGGGMGISSSAGSHKSSYLSNKSSSNNLVKFNAALGRDPEKARRALLEASDDALGVQRRTFMRRFTMFVKLLIFLAFAATLAFLAQLITSIQDSIDSRLSDVTLVRAIADGKPIAAGKVVSFSASGVQQGHGPTVGVAVTALPCEPEPSSSRVTSRVFFPNGNSTSTALVSAYSTTSRLFYWMVDSALSDGNNNQINVTLNTTDENSAANSHIALAGVGSTTFNGGDYSKSPFFVITGAASGSSSVYLHLVEDPSANSQQEPKATILASYFTPSPSSNTDRSTAFAVTVPPPTYFSTSSSSSSSSQTHDEVAVVGYICGTDVCCIDLISWKTGGVLSGSDGPRLTMPKCPTHAVHFPSINSDHPDVSHVVLPTLPVIVLTVNVSANTVKVTQTLKLPITFADTTSAMQIGNSTSSQIRVTSIPPPHNKKSVLVSVALHDEIQVFQLLPATSSSGTRTFLVPSLFATIPVGLPGPISLSGFVFSTTNSWASVYFRDANKFQYMIQLSFLSAPSDISIPRRLPSVGGAHIEALWLSEVWRHTMIVIRESPRFCGLRSVEWQGGLTLGGVAGSTVQAGQTVDVYTGGVVRIFAGLVPGGRYGVGVNGSLVAVHDPMVLRTSSAYDVIGKALSTTEMFLYPTR